MSVVRMGVTQAVLDQLGSRRCKKIGRVIIQSMMESEEIEECEREEQAAHAEQLEQECGLSLLLYNIDKVTEVLMGFIEEEPWVEEDDGPEPQYNRISKWFEL